MATVTADKLITLIEKSQLVEPEVLREALDGLRAEHDGQLPEDPVALAKALRKRKIITRWHCEKLLQGKYKGFFLGKHKLLGHLGSGGMSSVYLAEHTKMHDLRAVKVLPQSKLGKSSYLARFQQEAKAIASLNHPNVVRAYDIDNQGDTHYIVMEYVDGDDLQTIVRKKGPLSIEKATRYMIQAARGLQHAHEIGLIHRDVKPANLLINSRGQVKLLDLGLALFTDDSAASLTMDFNDKVLGTADFLAPEQALNSHKVDHRVDLYGLGCTLYFLLTGKPPFPDGTIAQRIAKHQKEMPVSIRKLRPNCPGELEGICWKLLQKDPKFRYASAAQTADVLDEWLNKYLAEKRAQNGGDSSPELSGVSSGSSGSLSGLSSSSMIDTVSNRGGDTVAGRSGSSVTNLSTSDSGVLVKVAKKAKASDTSSQIDLHAEIAKRRRGGSSTHGGRAQVAKQQRRPAQPIRPGKPQLASANTATNRPISQRPGVRIAAIAGLIIMFILAVLLGILIARFTAPEATPNLPAAAQPAIENRLDREA